MQRLQPIAPRSADQARQVATAQLLQQVAMLANSVTRLARKMQHNHGHLSPPEQAQLDLQLRLLDTHMVQLHHNQPVTTASDLFAPPQFLYHTTTTNTAMPPHLHHHRHHPLQHHLQQHHQARPQTFPLHDDEEDKARSVADTSSTPSSPNAAEPAEEAQKAAANSLGRRRTKRLFHDRACQDCHTRFTSQWRTGPTGPSTLCNACGIRYARLGRQVGKPQLVPLPAAVAATRSSIQFLLN